ncbi:MAG: hypothetical protein AVDCRST_MAG40-2006, partial [uncultured Gemmatimonadaceae bacterium]
EHQPQASTAGRPGAAPPRHRPPVGRRAGQGARRPRGPRAASGVGPRPARPGPRRLRARDGRPPG